MANDDLVLRIGITERRLLDQIKRVEQRMIRSAQKSERGWAAANRRIGQSFSGIGAAATKAAASVAAFALAANRLNRSADAYIQIENRLRSIGETSDEAGEKLLAAAIRSRAGIEEMSTSVARFEKATGDGFDVAVRRIETLNKLLAVTGSTTSEVNSVMQQFAQALTSGALQGDELRSLRENAPIEVLDALAEAAGTTRDELKQLGADGAITAEIMTTALDNLAATADEKFGETTQTVGQAFTNIGSAVTVFVGRLNEGIGASEGLAGAMSEMATFLQENVGEAEEFGRSVQAALTTGIQYADVAHEALSDLAGQISAVTDDIFGIGEAFADGSVTTGDAINAILNALGTMSGALSGSAAATREAFLQMIDAVTGGIDAAVDATITGVETMVNGILEGLRNVIAVLSLINPAMGQAAGAIGGGVTLPRPGSVGTSLSGGSVGDAFQSSFDAEKAAFDSSVESVKGFFEGIRETYDRNRKALEQLDIERELPQDVSPGGPGSGTGTGSGGGGSGKGGGKGKTGKKQDPFFADIERDLVNLQRQIELVGKSKTEVAELEARWRLLDEAKKRGIPINAQLNEMISAQASEFGRLTGELERAEIAQQQFDEAIDGIADAMAGALVAGESLRDGLAQVFKQIAADILNSGIRQALTSAFGGGGGGLLSFLGFGGGDALSGALRGAGLNPVSFDGGGFTGSGSRSGGIDGRGGFPAILHPNETVVDHTRGQSTGGMTFAPSISIAGDASEKTVGLIERALERERSQFFGRWQVAQKEFGNRIA